MKALPMSIPPRTRAELASPAPRGHRHEQMKKLVLPLLAAGLTPDAVFVQLRGTYEPDVSDREIHDLIQWAVSKNPRPFGCGGKLRSHNVLFWQAPLKPQRVTATQAIATTEKWLSTFRCDERDLWHASPWRPLEDWRFDALMLFAALYDKDEYVNVVTDFTIEQKDGRMKANPKGPGRTL